MNPHKVTEEFEHALQRYTGAPFVVAVDSCCSALFLAFTYHNVKGKKIGCPSRTYVGVPNEIKHAGGIIEWQPVDGETITGAYRFEGTTIWDSALRLTSNMYLTGQTMCLSFTGPRKHLKLSKGGAILTDSENEYEWYKRARYSGRRPISYHEDHFDMLGWNKYMIPDLSARGLLLLSGFPEYNEDLTLPYPDLSKFSIFTE
jgi:dTDP-4-amino-4,6-dideoxygalactose transaminase